MIHDKDNIRMGYHQINMQVERRCGMRASKVGGVSAGE